MLCTNVHVDASTLRVAYVPVAYRGVCMVCTHCQKCRETNQKQVSSWNALRERDKRQYFLIAGCHGYQEKRKRVHPLVNKRGSSNFFISSCFLDASSNVHFEGYYDTNMVMICNLLLLFHILKSRGDIFCRRLICSWSNRRHHEKQRRLWCLLVAAMLLSRY